MVVYFHWYLDDKACAVAQFGRGLLRALPSKMCPRERRQVIATPWGFKERYLDSNAQRNIYPYLRSLEKALVGRRDEAAGLGEGRTARCEPVKWQGARTAGGSQIGKLWYGYLERVYVSLRGTRYLPPSP